MHGAFARRRCRWANRPWPLKPGTFHPTYSRGPHAVLPEGVRGQAEPLTLALDLELVGTERLSIVPLGGNTDVKMTGSWPHPRSTGGSCRQSAPGARGLHGPVAPVIAGHHGAAGCAGRPPHLRWQLRRCPHEYAPTGTTPRDGADSFGVAFVDPVNPYTLADRATKYGLLFIALTFVAVGLFELMGNGPTLHCCAGRCPRGPLFVLGRPGDEKAARAPGAVPAGGRALCSFFLLLVSFVRAPALWLVVPGCGHRLCAAGLLRQPHAGRLARGCRWASGIALVWPAVRAAAAGANGAGRGLDCAVPGADGGDGADAQGELVWADACTAQHATGHARRRARRRAMNEAASLARPHQPSVGLTETEAQRLSATASGCRTRCRPKTGGRCTRQAGLAAQRLSAARPRPLLAGAARSVVVDGGHVAAAFRRWKAFEAVAVLGAALIRKRQQLYI